MSTTAERQLDYGPQRAAWVFQIKAKDLVVATQAKLAFHRERLAFWTREADDASAKLQASMKIRETAVTGGVQHTAVFDPQESERVKEAERKRDSHRLDVENFANWEAVLKVSNGETFLPCTIADAVHFGLADVPLTQGY